MATQPTQGPSRATPQIPGYRVVGRLGAGGMGVVYKAIQLSMNRPVALKVLYARYSKNSESLERFRREVAALAKLSHPNIVLAIDTGQAGGAPFYAMEFVDGATVSDMVKKQGAMTESRILEVALQVARALAHAYRHKLIHRDIKPDNIMVTDEGVAKLCDLGIAKSLEEGVDTSLTTEGFAVGTPSYLSPEQAQGLPADQRSDIYSLGVTMYYMATGKPPFGAETAAAILRQHLTVTPPSPNRMNPRLSGPLSQVIMKMLQKDPADRYQTAQVLVTELERLQKRGATAGPVRRSRLPQPEEPTQQAVRFIKPALITATVLLLLAFGVLVYVTQFMKKPPAFIRRKPPSTVGKGKGRTPVDKPPDNKPPNGNPVEASTPRMYLQQAWVELEAAVRARTRDVETSDLMVNWFAVLLGVRKEEPDLSREYEERARTLVRELIPPMAEIELVAADESTWELEQEKVRDWSERIHYLLWIFEQQPQFLPEGKGALVEGRDLLQPILGHKGTFQLSINVFPPNGTRVIELANGETAWVREGRGLGPLAGWTAEDLEMPLGIGGLTPGPWKLRIAGKQGEVEIDLDPEKIRPGARVSVWGTLQSGKLEVSYR